MVKVIRTDGLDNGEPVIEKVWKVLMEIFELATEYTAEKGVRADKLPQLTINLAFQYQSGSSSSG